MLCVLFRRRVIGLPARDMPQSTYERVRRRELYSSWLILGPSSALGRASSPSFLSRPNWTKTYRPSRRLYVPLGDQIAFDVDNFYGECVDHFKQKLCVV